jgi:hypothetical protein
MSIPSHSDHMEGAARPPNTQAPTGMFCRTWFSELPMIAMVPPTATTPPMMGPHVVTPVVAAERKLLAGPEPSMLFLPSLVMRVRAPISRSHAEGHGHKGCVRQAARGFHLGSLAASADSSAAPAASSMLHPPQTLQSSRQTVGTALDNSRGVGKPYAVGHEPLASLDNPFVCWLATLDTVRDIFAARQHTRMLCTVVRCRHQKLCHSLSCSLAAGHSQESVLLTWPSEAEASGSHQTPVTRGQSSEGLGVGEGSGRERGATPLEEPLLESPFEEGLVIKSYETRNLDAAPKEAGCSRGP